MLRHRVLTLLLAISSGALCAALSLPFFEIKLSTGDSLIDALAWWAYGADFANKQYSVLTGIAVLFNDGEVGIASLIFAFSVVFPIAKHLAFWRLASTRRLTTERLRVLESFGLLSLVDPLVVALSVLAFKRFPAGSISVCSGFYLFVISIVAACLRAFLARRLHASGGDGQLSICT